MKTNSYLSLVLLCIFALLMTSGCSGKKASDPVSNDQPGNSGNQDVFWKALETPASAGCASTDADNNIWIGTSFGMYKSPDSGSTWNKVTTNGFTSTSSVSLIRPALSGKIYAMAGSDIYTLNTSQNTWMNISKNINSSTVTYIKTQTFNLDKAGNIYACMFVSVKSDPQTIGLDQNIFVKSTDGGQTWTEIKIQQFEGQIIDIAFTSNGAILLIMDNTVYRSLDGGKTWNHASSGIPSSNPMLLRVNSMNLVYGGTGNGIMVSGDTGITWSPANYSTYCPSLIINSKDYLFAGAINSVFVSVDNAEKWVEISSGLKHSIDGFSNCSVQTFDKDGFIYAILEGVLYKSSVSTVK
ncbi:MAG: WD40/YVTN/BNR-like repeat-containing protein [Syntrophomonadaceae bacterium]